MADIFVSYASEDRPKILGLKDSLEAEGWSVFWDRTIPPGESWSRFLAKELDGARCVLVVWSKQSVVSDWVYEEAARAKSRGVLIPVAIDSASIPLGFASIQAVQLPDLDDLPTSVDFRTLLGAIERLAPRQPEMQISGRDRKVIERAGFLSRHWKHFGALCMSAGAIGLLWFGLLRSTPDQAVKDVAFPTSQNERAPAGDERTSASSPATSTPLSHPGEVAVSSAGNQEHSSISSIPPDDSSISASRSALTSLGITMIPIEGGRFRMGALRREGFLLEPILDVRVPQFRLARTEVTRGQFRTFINATGYETEGEKNVDGNGCTSIDLDTGKEISAGLSWKNPGFPQTDKHPVVCVSWNDAKRFVEWVNGITHQKFRLPTQAEWEFAARGRTEFDYWWGDDPSDACTNENAADATRRPGSGRSWIDLIDPDDDYAVVSCSDGYVFTAPVGQFESNPFGLLDMLGNVTELTEDCWHFTNDRRIHLDAPTDGSASRVGDCTQYTSRGGSFAAGVEELRVWEREGSLKNLRYSYTGFRLAAD